MINLQHDTLLLFTFSLNTIHVHASAELKSSSATLCLQWVNLEVLNAFIISWPWINQWVEEKQKYLSRSKINKQIEAEHEWPTEDTSFHFITACINFGCYSSLMGLILLSLFLSFSLSLFLSYSLSLFLSFSLSYPAAFFPVHSIPHYPLYISLYLSVISTSFALTLSGCVFVSTFFLFC